MKAWIGPALGISIAMSLQVDAQVRPPSTANPLQNLPRVETPVTPRVNEQVQKQAPNPRLAALLATPITPRRFDVVGVHAVPFKEIAALFSPMTGKNVHVADVLAAANKVSDVYKAHGYALSFGFVPTQDFANGDVHITIVEGYVATVDITGDAGNMAPKIRAIAQHIAKDRPLRQKTFERYLQVLGMLPGLHIDANVPAPTTTDGATRLELSVKRTRFNATTGIDFDHPGVQGLTGVTENGLLGQAEQVGFSTLLPSGPGDQRLYALAYLQPLWSDGLMLHVNASHYQGNPDTDDQLPSYLQQNMHQDQYTFSFSYPLLLDNHHSLTATGGAYATTLNETYTNTVTGARLIQQYGLRVLDAKMDWIKAGDTSVQKVNLEIAHGLDALGANASTVVRVGNLAEAVPADPQFTRYDATFIQSNVWPHHFGTVFNITGQYSNNTLPTTEQVSFGGPRYGLAYDPGETAGDSGWGASMEVNRSFDVSTRWVKQVTPYLIGQYARVYLNVGAPTTAQLGTAGLGVRWSDKRYYTFDLTFAEPVGDVPFEAPHREPRVDFSFSYQLH
ncbi:ShlB/FhaC/HecB family hemolysin secretion/activation protein [Dyella acidiphila]|uniref:ShlB/FhaC/HecB family hemolysin secretion/activation protein n=1 Tax=Dyella acidiphila TaxID=2775866 RepID=A0ABR9GEZ2_9GAMM|nr:ShlB/FhaC/HecB family hemolysin secretion/activation protein [Dyella acidiphila]MBE1162616.1 ShlB/FhaC/HecB family hemolysin secretion/activation protein [Dyella acidiphila]